MIWIHNSCLDLCSYHWVNQNRRILLQNKENSRKRSWCWFQWFKGWITLSTWVDSYLVDRVVYLDRNLSIPSHSYPVSIYGSDWTVSTRKRSRSSGARRELSLVFTSNASAISVNKIILILPWTRNKRDRIFPFSCACVCAAISYNEIHVPLRHNTSTRIFATRGCLANENTRFRLPCS